MSTKNKWLLGGVIILGVWFVIGISPYCLESNTTAVSKMPSETEQALWAIRGQMGDMFGAVNSLFSALALAALVYTVLLQRKELKLQREELAMTREELERSAKAQEITSSAMSEQLDLQYKAAKLTALNEEIGFCDDTIKRLSERRFDIQRAKVRNARSCFCSQKNDILKELDIEQKGEY